MRRMRTAILLLLCVASSPGANSTWVPAKYLSGLPSNAFVRATAIDSTDTVLIAGSTGNTDAFLARYSLDGLHQLSYLLLHNTTVSAITSDRSGSSYLT